MGVTTGPALGHPSTMLNDGNDEAVRADGAVSVDGQVLATYLHGVFDHPQACQALLQWAGLAAAQAVDLNALREASLERMADTLEQHLDMNRLLAQLHA